MTNPVGLNTSLVGNNYNISQSNANTSALNTADKAKADSIFSNSAFSPVVNDYNGDFMMSNMDFSALAGQLNNQIQQTAPAQVQNPQPQSQNQTTSQVQNPVPQVAQNQTPAFTSNPQQPDMNGLNGCLTDNTQAKKSNIGKVAGASLGFLAPIAGKIVDVCKGQAFKDVFKVKQLAVTCPILGVVGLGVGMLVDGFLNSKREKTVDKPQQPLQTFNPTQPMNIAA